MRSGEPTQQRGEESYKNLRFKRANGPFAQIIFHAKPGLVKTNPETGWRQWKPYNGQEYDRNEFTLVQGMWDHEHCDVCYFTITEGMTFWQNNKGIAMLCDECHDFAAALRLIEVL